MYKKSLAIFRYRFMYVIILFFINQVKAQTLGCAFKEPIITINFGTTSNPKDIDLAVLKSYGKSKSTCPIDGSYIFTDYTANCFGSKWHTLLQDHTQNDVNGRMMLVNASERPSTFFSNNIAGLTAGKMHEFSFWIVNICKSADGCTPTPPNIKVALLNGNRVFDRFETGAISQTAQPRWRFFLAEFFVPEGASNITLRMDDITDGGCGNDFAIDDIVIKECKVENPIVKEIPKSAIVTPKKKAETKPIVKVPAKEPNLNATKPIESLEKQKLPIKTTSPAITKIPINQAPITLPKPIATRENLLIRKIEVEESEMLIELYDNGEIDGDTVSIYHNNKLIVSRAGLSAKPISINIKIDKEHPHHELVMVADNLGSIPPNTSLMIITANKNRYEVFISSSEQRNAKVIIDLK